jgi:hypothetical protein
MPHALRPRRQLSRILEHASQQVAASRRPCQIGIVSRQHLQHEADLGAERQPLPGDPLVEDPLPPGPGLAHPCEAGELGPEAAPVTERADVTHLVEEGLADEAQRQAAGDQDGARPGAEAAVGPGEPERRAADRVAGQVAVEERPVELVEQGSQSPRRAPSSARRPPHSRIGRGSSRPGSAVPRAHAPVIMTWSFPPRRLLEPSSPEAPLPQWGAVAAAVDGGRSEGSGAIGEPSGARAPSSAGPASTCCRTGREWQRACTG